ncbi:transmembrane and coiled-coil domain-containing protein 5B-like [Echinops telfairi]|uniref:Transmembrane and coiled-coil domain-containing protein 5B-like n=1 Tax=Echinops telfairi TaxID=9371 RepID=A0ABM0J1F8_ECHTE|nr:transmembrane and coiled-coil domain-containing protein 5B-like [Echinops telfairi]
MEEVEQDPVEDMCDAMEIPKLEVTKQNLDYLNSDLEKDLQRLDQENQVLLKQIQEKEEIIQSLEREITRSVGLANEKDELSSTFEMEDALRDVELETAKLEKHNKILSKNVLELQKQVSRRLKKGGIDTGTLKQMVTESKVRLQKATEFCATQEKELAKLESDYQSVYQLCEDQTHYIKKYQEVLRAMEQEKDTKLLEKEVSKAQNNFSQIVKPGSILVETIQSNMERKIIKKQRKIFWYTHFRCLVFFSTIFLRLLGYVLFHLQCINPNLFAETLPMVMSRSTLKSLRDFLSPFLTLEVEEVLPH